MIWSRVVYIEITSGRRTGVVMINIPFNNRTHSVLVSAELSESVSSGRPSTDVKRITIILKIIKRRFKV